jgi:23S rRNA pseudouridine1911/1915/1917 synthase
MPEVTLPSGFAPDRIDRVLAGLLEGVSRAQVQRWIDEGRVSVDGRPARSKDRVAAGQRIAYEVMVEPGTTAEPDAAVPFRVVYDDAHLVVVDKPAGIVVHPARGNLRGTLVNGLLALPGFERSVDERDPDGQRRPGIVHRIDKDTSGILVVAKDAPTREGLKQQFATHTIHRVYQAISVGVPTAERYDTWYGRHPSQRIKFSSRGTGGKRAVTHVRLRQPLRLGCAWVECQLETGRTHQIRVHLAEQAGCPLLADALYGTRPAHPTLREIADQLGRQALHAATLGFTHPITGEMLSFDSPLPEDMQRALDALRALA